MIDYLRGGSFGLAMILLASHANAGIILGFFVVTMINFFLCTSYYIRYFKNK